MRYLRSVTPALEMRRELLRCLAGVQRWGRRNRCAAASVDVAVCEGSPPPRTGRGPRGLLRAKVFRSTLAESAAGTGLTEAARIEPSSGTPRVRVGGASGAQPPGRRLAAGASDGGHRVG